MPATIKKNKKIVSVPKTICSEKNKRYVKIGEKFGVQKINTHNKTYINFFSKQKVFSVCLRPTDNQKIIEIIECLYICKYPIVIYYIPTTLIKEARYFIAPFNESIKSGNYADILKIAK